MRWWNRSISKDSFVFGNVKAGEAKVLVFQDVRGRVPECSIFLFKTRTGLLGILQGVSHPRKSLLGHTFRF